MSNPIFPVVLSGGTGSRLWPLSRELHPKQFIPLDDEFSLLQATVRRLSSLENLQSPIVVCNEAHRFMVIEQLKEIGVEPTAILLEPKARNTAPAVAAAALETLTFGNDGKEPVLLVLPADHIIRDENSLANAIREATIEAVSDKLVTFGVVPGYAESGYGYIKSGSLTGLSANAYVVERFVEKPDADTAAMFFKDGGYYWNSGMFVFTAAQYLRELEIHADNVLHAVTQAHTKAVQDLGFLRLDTESFTNSPDVSVDYAVMEHTSEAVMVSLDVGWSDLGSWDVLSRLTESDDDGNVTHGDVILESTRNTYILGGGRLVAAVGVEDSVIVETADAILVAEKSSVQDIKKVVEKLKIADRDEYRVHRKVHRPWGTFNLMYSGDGFKIKHIIVNPGQQLSLQSHRHRAEHWIVVCGTAKVTRGDEIFQISENQSTFIPQGTRHRLQNPDSVPLELIEVQTGSYLNEDDIVRYEDFYGRSK